MRATERIEDGLSPGAAESLTGIVALAQWLRRAVIVALVVSVTVLCITAAGHNF
jgi:hypothetical protein